MWKSAYDPVRREVRNSANVWGSAAWGTLDRRAPRGQGSLEAFLYTSSAIPLAPRFSLYSISLVPRRVQAQLRHLGGIPVKLAKVADKRHMSLSARERRNPPPRRKSCSACIKSKRRCDTALPACLRCSQRRIACVYPARTEATQLEQFLSEQYDMPILSQVDAMPLPLIAEKDAAPSAFSFNDAPEAPLDSVAVLLADADPPFIDVAPFLELDASTPMDLIHQTSWLDRRDETRTGIVADIIAQRMRYAMDQLKNAPHMFVSETRAPWCHSQLYSEEMPACIRDVHACCGLYMAKNAVNGTVILRSIESRVQELLATPLPTTEAGLMARVHSLLLYQIIRLFDGDIASRAAAERSMQALEDAALALLPHVQWCTEGPEGELELFPMGPTKRFWQEWLLHESARRTVLMAFFFNQTYRLVSGQRESMVCDGKLGLCHSWTVSAHLWHAETPLEFARAWREHDHYVVTNAQFSLMLKKAEASDVDIFGRIFISCLLGVEEAAGWFESRGGSL
ncbi:hypothetical protein B0I35DRAFT_409791 [Stachybotrys elegans]|uniref:Zn(2)-C6 fungal-type domain-containing protein n=1 Tax=Stachybotrys elegans TaxID=80388 RepID=A0A8K0WRI1_9HYPO|nr:hypothetical protein B0I35DRAFT_409791 [Stachybotrys elegans]